MRSKKLVWITFPIILLTGIYFLGSQPETPLFDRKLPAVPAEANALEDYVAETESLHRIKPDNEARIVWVDSTKRKTPFSVL